MTTNLGILGCGNIFGRYVAGLHRYPELRIVRVADVDTDRAKQAAAEYDLPTWGTMPNFTRTTPWTSWST